MKPQIPMSNAQQNPKPQRPKNWDFEYWGLLGIWSLVIGHWVFKKYQIPDTRYRIRGFTLLEAVVYIAILSLIFVVAVHTTIVATSAFGKSRVKSALAAEGLAAMERVLHEVRLAHGIDSEASVFGANPGVLKLKTRVSADDATETTRTFNLSSGTLQLTEAGGEPAPLSGSIEITELTFTRIGTPYNPRAVRVTLAAESSYKTLRDTRKFYGTAVLRGGY